MSARDSSNYPLWNGWTFGHACVFWRLARLPREINQFVSSGKKSSKLHRQGEEVYNELVLLQVDFFNLNIPESWLALWLSAIWLSDLFKLLDPFISSECFWTSWFLMWSSRKSKMRKWNTSHATSLSKQVRYWCKLALNFLQRPFHRRIINQQNIFPLLQHRLNRIL